jgi:large repetitive protein
LRNKLVTRLSRVLYFSILSAGIAIGQVNITTWQGDLQHTGANLNETALTPANVGSVGNFGVLFTQPLDGESYGQPLYVTSGTLGKFADGTSHNVVYVATEHDGVFAFDADNNAIPLWSVSLLPSGTIPVPQGDVGSGDIGVELGITTTPVIDTAGQTLYVVSKVKKTADGTYQQYLHALDLKTGAEKLNGPVLINPTFAGNAQDREDPNGHPAGSNCVSANGVIPFCPLHEHMRAAMVLFNGVVYLSYGSHGDTQAYHGEILGYDANTLQLVKTFITTPNGGPNENVEGGFWGGGAGPAVDSQGNMFVMVANGAFDQAASQFTTGTNWGESILKLPTTGSFNVSFSNPLNWFTPSNYADLNGGDVDLGSSGLLLLPDQAAGTHQHIAVGGGKGGILYVVDRDNLGGLHTPDNSIQEVAEGRRLFVTPAYFNGYIYYTAEGGPLEQRAVGFDPTTNGYISDPPIKSDSTYGIHGSGAFISANTNTDGIVWVVNGNILDAYDARNVSGQPIYRQTSSVNNIGCNAAKFTLPMVSGGKVYYTCFDPGSNASYLFVSGLLPVPVGSPASPAGAVASATSATNAQITWTDNSDNEAGFAIKRATSAAGPFNQVGSVTSNVTAFTDSGLSPSTQYFYQVAAFNSLGASSASNVATTTTFPEYEQNGLVAYWNFDDGVPNPADVTGRGHGATVNGEAGSAQGFVNLGYNFHGAGQAASRLEVSNAPDLQFTANQSFSLTAWALPLALSGKEQTIIAKSADQGNPYGISINAAGEWVGRGPQGDIVGSAAVQGVWTHVALVQDGSAGTRSLYVNGVLAASGTAQAADGAGDLWMAQRNVAGDVAALPGSIDEVRVYNTALAPGQVMGTIAPPVVNAVSSMQQGGAGTFGVTLFPSATSVIEPREGATPGNYTIALTFAAPVSGVSASISLQGGGNAVGSVTSVTPDSTGRTLTVALSGVANDQALNLHLAGIMPGNGSADIPVNVLWGDANGDHVVDNHDLILVQNSFTATVNQASALYDISSDGAVNSVDASLISAAIGTSLGAQTDSNLAVFQPAAASTINGGNTAALAFDNDPNTRWESQSSDPQWLAVDLGLAANIHKIVLNWENAAGQNYQLQVSNDNVNWTTVQNVVNNSGGGIRTYSGLNASGRYVRMYGTSRTTAYGYSLFEFQVWGVPGSGGGGANLPAITSPTSASGTVGAAFSYQITATQNPTSFGATGLPAGLSIDTTTGAITGTPTTAGTSSVTILASNAGGSGSATLTLTINGNGQTDSNLALNQPATASSVNGGNIAAAAFDSDPNTRWESQQGVDPQWLEVDLGLAANIHKIVLNWENAAGQNYQLQVSNDNINWTTIQNVVGNPGGGILTYNGLTATGRYVRMYGTTRTTGYGYSLFDFQVWGTPVILPVITSPTSASGTVGAAFSYQITASQNPTSFGATGLPAGLSIDATTGAITGTPTTAGTSSVTISAFNAAGSGSATLALTINSNAQTDSNLALNQPATASSVNGGNTAAAAFDSDPNTRWESQQGVDPQWLAVDLGLAANIHKIVLNWENAAGQNYQLQVSNDNINWTTVQNVVGNPGGGILTYSELTATGRYVRMYGTTRTTAYGYSLFDFQVWGIPASGGAGSVPAITSSTSASGTVGVAFSYQITASQNPTSFGAMGLPAGLSIDATTGAITGTPTTAGTSSVTINASNTSGSGLATLALTINPNGQTDSNLALNQPATASSVNGGNTAAAAFDNNLTTRWESQQGVDPQWLAVDLGLVANIHKIVLNWENAAGQNYQLQVSNDNINWTVVQDVVGNPGGGIRTYDGLTATGRYVRMYGTTRTTAYGYSLFDFQVWGVPAN